jgi:hypothetical protein
MIKNLQNDKAIICAGKNCVTVYGDTAKIINAIIIATVALFVVTLLVKELR